MQIKAVLFDMFDTLMLIIKDHEFYSSALKRMHKYLVSAGVEVSLEEFESAYLEARDELYAKADVNFEEPHFNVRVVNALQKIGYDYLASSPVVSGATNEFCLAFMAYVRIDEHAETVLRRLRGRYKLGIVSNFAIPECVFKLLENHGLNEFFDVVVVSGAVNKRKPSPEIFKKALKLLGVSSAEAVFVGDTADADIGGAKAVGMRTVYVERRVEKGLCEVCPDLVIRSLGDLPLALERF